MLTVFIESPSMASRVTASVFKEEIHCLGPKVEDSVASNKDNNGCAVVSRRRKTETLDYQHPGGRRWYW